MYKWIEFFQSKKSKWSKKHMKKCSTSMSIKEMPFKTKLRFYLTLVRIAVINTNNKCWWGCGEIGILIHCWWKSKLVQPLWKIIWRRIRKLKIDLSYYLAIPFLGVCPKECESAYNRHLHTHVYCSTIHNS
jgi:hypothetical protein